MHLLSEVLVWFKEWSAELLSILALWISFFSLRQGARHRRKDQWLAINDIILSTEAQLLKNITDAEGLKRQWAFRAARAGLHGPASRKAIKAAELDAIVTECHSLKASAPSRPSVPSFWSVTGLERELREAYQFRSQVQQQTDLIVQQSVELERATQNSAEVSATAKRS